MNEYLFDQLSNPELDVYSKYYIRLVLVSQVTKVNYRHIDEDDEEYVELFLNDKVVFKFEAIYHMYKKQTKVSYRNPNTGQKYGLVKSQSFYQESLFDVMYNFVGQCNKHYDIKNLKRLIAKNDVI